MKLREAESWDGLDCTECEPEIDLKTLRAIRPDGLMILELGVRMQSHWVRLCPRHRHELAELLGGVSNE